MSPSVHEHHHNMLLAVVVRARHHQLPVRPYQAYLDYGCLSIGRLPDAPRTLKSRRFKNILYIYVENVLHTKSKRLQATSCIGFLLVLGTTTSCKHASNDPMQLLSFKTFKKCVAHVTKAKTSSSPRRVVHWVGSENTQSVTNAYV